MFRFRRYLCAVYLGSISAIGAAAPSTSAATATVTSEPKKSSPGTSGGAQSVVTVYSGYYNSSAGYSDRFVSGSFLDWYRADLGIHTDLVFVDRERTAAFAAFGLSNEIEGLGRLKITAGGSTGGQSILPNLSAHAELEIKPANGLIARPAIHYRRFRGGISHVTPAVQLAYYFGGGEAGYFVGQTDASLTIVDPKNVGWSLGAGVTNVRPSGLRLGLAGRAGKMAYDSISGLEVRSNFIGGGPTIGYRFANGREVFLRSDLTYNQFYTVSGAIVGVKTPL